MGILDFLKKNVQNKNNSIKTEEKKKLVYDEIIEVTHTNTENRQGIIKKLYQDEEPIECEYGRLLACKPDIEDGEMLSGKKCIKVIVENDKGFKDELGYIPDKYYDILHSYAGPTRGYTVDLYAKKEVEEYKLNARIKFFDL